MTLRTEYDVHILPLVNNGLGWERSIEEDYWIACGADREAALMQARQAGERYDQALVHWSQYRGDEVISAGEEAEYGPGTANCVTARDA